MPQPLHITPFKLAERFVGLKELPGPKHEPFVLGMLQLDAKWVQDDETAWCSAFVNYCNHLLRQPRSKSLAARSWLQIGEEIPLGFAQVGFDVVILQRGAGKQPGPEVIKAPGHVGYYAGKTPDGKSVLLLGGNQANAVNVAAFAIGKILGVRRCYASAEL